MPGQASVSRRRLLAWSGALCAAAPGAWAAEAQDVTDVLRRPAAPSRHAGSSAMLAVTRAGQRLVAVGERGIVLLSDDHGATWRQAQVPVSVSLTAVQFADASQGWAVGHGGAVLASSDGGASWTLQLDGTQAAQIALQAARAEADKTGEAGRQRLAEAERLVADDPDKPFLDLFFADARNGFIVGAYGLAFRTQDGGRHWQSWMGALPNPRARHLYRIAAAGPRFFIAGEQGLLLRSDDRGAAFATAESPYDGTYFGVQACADGGLLAFGLRGNAFACADTARPWTKLGLPTASSLVDCVPLADGPLLLVDQQGQTFLGPNAAQAAAFKRSTLDLGEAVSAATQAADGSVVAATLLGMKRSTTRPQAAAPRMAT